MNIKKVVNQILPIKIAHSRGFMLQLFVTDNILTTIYETILKFINYLNELLTLHFFKV
jgi:hypothetical protein